MGGTFTDCIAVSPNGAWHQHKTLSSGAVKGIADSRSSGRTVLDPRRERDPDGIWNGYSFRLPLGDDVAAASSPGFGLVSESIELTVERFEDGVLHLSSDVGGALSGMSYELVSPDPAPLVAIRYVLGCPTGEPLPPLDVRLGTTRGTNALITRSGAATALVTTRNFRDVLRIGYQARPDLFAVNITKPDELYDTVIELDERTDTEGQVLRPLNREQLREQLVQLSNQGIDSLAVVLLHACANPTHEKIVGEVAAELGVSNVSLSHSLSSLRKFVPRGDTTVMDAYLNPVLQQYVQQIRSAISPDSRLELMMSSGGLTPAESFRGKDSILSGPAGGVVGVARAAKTAGYASAIGFDMGGTSTDVSRWDGQFQLEFETEKAGQRIATPMMAIETVAAGGGSICHFDGVKLCVGPDSAGASPGPACYGNGGPLAITDVNFYLGKILPEAFPFALDREAVERRLVEVGQSLEAATGTRYSNAQLAEGFLRIANTHMAEAIRCVSVDCGVDPRNDVLVAFGGAAAQHACAVADELGMREILLHPCAGIMSALGIGLADHTVHRETGFYRLLDELDDDLLERTFEQLAEDGARELLADGAAQDAIQVSRFLDLRFAGLDESIRIPQPSARGSHAEFQSAYETEFKRRCGYLPNDRALEVVTARVQCVVSSTAESGVSHRLPSKLRPQPAEHQSVHFGDGAVSTAVLKRTELKPGSVLIGPAIITESISTIVVDPGWSAEVLSGGEILLLREEAEIDKAGPTGEKVETLVTAAADPVLLEVFNKRFAAIAAQMGSTLRRSARSVNVKERLDYSCAIFTAAGELVVNAPHIPVHLGAMGATVRHVLEAMTLAAGDVVITNDPYHGGSHLPDVTVITPHHDEAGQLRFVVASRAHHAEIGGMTPGSMPPFSTNLAEEGVLIRAMKVIDGGESRLDDLANHLHSAKWPSRDVETNVADIIAQIAANRHGVASLRDFVAEYSWPVVARYMNFIQEAAAIKTRRAIASMPDGEREFTDYLDDGSPIRVRLTVEGDTAVLNFDGTAGVLAGNLNANRAIVTAATLYCLRLLIDEDIPLNEGVLEPVQIELPECLLNPAHAENAEDCPAIVGGNVETSQRIVDCLLGAFGIAAASQGTMNNFLFGDSTFGYYETICGGSGATRSAPGADAVHSHMTNTRLTDPEVMESRLPVRLKGFAIRANSGGAGEHRGGHGVVREVEFLKALRVSLLTQRRDKLKPWGIEGGDPGAAGVNTLIRGSGEIVPLKGIASLDVEVGDVIRIETPGGGGYGPAISRVDDE